MQEVLLSYLRKREDVTIHGEASANKELRVPVVSFTVKGKSSKDIVDGIESRSNFGCRWGHFYSKRMVDDLLGLGDCDGVVRVSMVHYNTGKSPCRTKNVKCASADCERSGRSGKVRQGVGRGAVGADEWNLSKRPPYRQTLHPFHSRRYIVPKHFDRLDPIRTYIVAIC